VALEGYVPVDVTKTFSAFLNFCYIAQKSILTEGDLDSLNTMLQRFHHYRVVEFDVLKWEIKDSGSLENKQAGWLGSGQTTRPVTNSTG